MVDLWSIGHSNRSLAAFIELLEAHRIEQLVDIRRFPGSRRLPHFGRESLEKELPRRGIDYVWMEELGGRRRSPRSAPTVNDGLINESFRAYADYMLTPEFSAAVDRLLELAAKKRTAIMCSEAVYWRCHRRLVCDYLLTRGVTVQHIGDARKPRPHVMTAPGQIVGDHVEYPAVFTPQPGT